MTDLLLSDHPADAVDDIALAATVGSDNPGDAFIKADKGLISKTLKPLNF
jgi:hypothetical protein